jgi:hypothetical protein
MRREKPFQKIQPKNFLNGPWVNAELGEWFLSCRLTTSDPVQSTRRHRDKHKIDAKFVTSIPLAISKRPL